AGIKIRCLNQLGDSPTAAPENPGAVASNSGAHRVPRKPARHESVHSGGQLVDHPLRFLAIVVGREEAAARACHARSTAGAKPLEMLANHGVAPEHHAL